MYVRHLFRSDTRATAERPRTRWRRLTVGAAVSAVVLSLAACGSGGGGSDAGDSGSQGAASGAAGLKTVEVPVITSLTGAGATLGIPIRDTLQAMANEMNKQHTIKGAQLKLKFYDNQSTPSTAVSVMAGLVKSSKFVMNGVLSSNVKASDELVTKDGPVIYSISPSIEPEPGSYIFVASASTLSTARAFAKYAGREGYKRVAFISSTDSSGTNGRAALQEVFKDVPGVRVVSDQQFGVSDASVSAQVTAVAAAKPDAVFIWTTGSQIGTVFQGLRVAGLKDIPTFVSSGNAYFRTMKTLKASLPTNLYTNGVTYMMTNVNLPAEQQKQVDLLLKGLGEKPGQIDIGASYAVDGLLIYASALNHLGLDASAAQIRDYWQSLKDFPGVDGIYNFTKTDHRGLADNGVGIVKYNESTGFFDPVSPLGG